MRRRNPARGEHHRRREQRNALLHGYTSSSTDYGPAPWRRLRNRAGLTCSQEWSWSGPVGGTCPPADRSSPDRPRCCRGRRPEWRALELPSRPAPTPIGPPRASSVASVYLLVVTPSSHVRVWSPVFYPVALRRRNLWRSRSTTPP